MMNKNTQCYYQNALQLHLIAEYDPYLDLLIILLGKKRYCFFRSVSPLNSYSSAHIAKNKYITYTILKNLGFLVPETRIFDEDSFQKRELVNVIEGLSFPLVIKPLEGALGENVLCNIKNMEQLQQYIPSLFLKCNSILIQEFHGNLQSYRVLVLKNKVIGVVLRQPAHVIGDGQHNLQELIDLTNIQRQKISDALGPIQVDIECEIRLLEQGIDLNYIPSNGQRVSLGYTSNATRGGTYISLGKQICKENKRLFIKAAKALNLELVGFDVECTDINIPIENSEGVIIEANHGPSVRIHEHAIAGIKTPVCKKVLRKLIYQHPFSYLYTLIKKASSSLYVRSCGILICFVLSLYLLTILLKFYSVYN